MNVLFVSAECYPFAKVGGLSDVVGTLPKNLNALKNDVRVIIPNFMSIPEKFKKEMKLIGETTVLVGWRQQYVGLMYLEYDKVKYYFIDNEYYFGKRDRIYDFMDEGERFAFFQLAVLESLKLMPDFRPEIIHTHDWHTGMIPHLIKSRYIDYQDIKTVFTIHNIAYQGEFPKETIDLFNVEFQPIVEYAGKLNFMKSAIAEADYITTVSNTYSKELLEDYYGFGMQSILNIRKKSFSGIINGIDYKVYNPEKDKKIAFKYNALNYREGKEKNKEALYKALGVDFYTDVPLISMITRLVSQKGLELVERVIEELLTEYKFKLLIIVTGEYRYEEFFKKLADKYPYKVVVKLEYNDDLAHLTYAASDIFLMPSKFEPCGLGQLIAMKYGALPLVRETGGLKDSVTPYNEFELTGNGFSFTNYNAHDMMYVIKYALRVYNMQKDAWNVLVEKAMSEDFGFKKSAREYNKLYKKILK